MRTGLLGGSFNPAHGGHRRISLFAKEALGLDEIWWLVSPGNPLKSKQGMAPLAARLQSAHEQARGVPIVPTAIESLFGTRFTYATLHKISQRYPKRQFLWLMGSDNLMQFHRWQHWRDIARSMPIAVIERPGYSADAMTSPAMAWLRQYKVPAARIRKRGQWSAPALVLMRFDPDPRSATAMRRDNPDWAEQYRDTVVRDRLTFREISGEGTV